jgi:hypothetical protein
MQTASPPLLRASHVTRIALTESRVPRDTNRRFHGSELLAKLPRRFGNCVSVLKCTLQRLGNSQVEWVGRLASLGDLRQWTSGPDETGRVTE